MSVAELMPQIEALPKAERLRLVRDVLSTLEVDEPEFPIVPTNDLLELAGIAKGPVARHARDHAEDEQFDR